MDLSDELENWASLTTPAFVDVRDWQALEASFQAAYSRIYGRVVPQAPIEATAMKVTVSGAERRIQRAPAGASSSRVRARRPRLRQ